MAIEILEIHHCGIRIGTDPEIVAKERDFYGTVLGLLPDPGRPDFPDLAGFWLNCGETGQVHLMAAEGQHPRAKGPGADPTLPHIAFAVADISETEAELQRLGTDYWTLDALGAPERRQLFLSDHSGNLIELHQADTCRCALRNRMR